MDHKDKRQIVYHTPYCIADAAIDRYPKLKEDFDNGDLDMIVDFLKYEKVEIDDLVDEFTEYVEKAVAEYESSV